MTTYDEALETEIKKLQAKIDLATAKRVEALRHPVLAQTCWASDSRKFVGECKCPQCAEIRDHLAEFDTLPAWLAN